MRSLELLPQILCPFDHVGHLVGDEVDRQAGDDRTAVGDLARTGVVLREDLLQRGQVCADENVALGGGYHQDVQDLGDGLVARGIAVEEGEADEEGADGLVELQRGLAVLG